MTSINDVQPVYVRDKGYIIILCLEDINAELDMTWKEDPTEFEYVRKGAYVWTKPKPQCRGRLIGYSAPLRVDQQYIGTMFYLMDRDKGMPNEDKAYGSGRPAEAVTIMKREKLPQIPKFVCTGNFDSPGRECNDLGFATAHEKINYPSCSGCRYNVEVPQDVV